MQIDWLMALGQSSTPASCMVPCTHSLEVCITSAFMWHVGSQVVSVWPSDATLSPYILWDFWSWEPSRTTSDTLWKENPDLSGVDMNVLGHMPRSLWVSTCTVYLHKNLGIALLGKTKGPSSPAFCFQKQPAFVYEGSFCLTTPKNHKVCVLLLKSDFRYVWTEPLLWISWVSSVRLCSRANRAIAQNVTHSTLLAYIRPHYLTSRAARLVSKQLRVLPGLFGLAGSQLSSEGLCL